MSVGINFSQAFYNFYKDKEDLFSFYGELSHTNITVLLKLIKSTLKLKTNLAITKKSYTLINESLENIINHNDKPEYLITFINIKQTDEKIIVKVVAPITELDADLLKTKVEIIKSLNEVELKKYYFECMTKTQTEKKTAGLGMIQMAMITNNNLYVNFFPYKDNDLLYELRLELIK